MNREAMLGRVRPSVVHALLVASAAVLAAFGTSADPEPRCGEAPDSSWLRPLVMQKHVETLGYTVENVAVSEGNCYEVSAFNGQGESVVTYFDPRTGAVVHETIAH